MGHDDPRVRTPDTFPTGYERPNTTVRGIVLAAGTSTRYGTSNKLLQELDGVPIVRHATETLVRSQVDDVSIVVGYQADQVKATVSGLDVSVCRNASYERGLSSSVRTGVRTAIESGDDAVLIALGDMPWVDSETANLLIEGYRRGVGDILVAAHDGQRGNPVLFDHRFFDALADIEGDTGGRQLLMERDDVVLIETDDRDVLRDIDSPGDLPRQP